MSSRIMMISLFAVAGLNLSFWGVSASAQSNNTCGQIGNQLSKAAEAQCRRSSKRFERDAKSDVKVTKTVEKAEDGSEKITGYEVEITTEANCAGCGVRSNEALRDNLTFTAGDNINEIRKQIDVRASELETQALSDLSEQIKLQKSMDKCLVDSSGEKLDKEGKRECQMEKLGALDDEEAAEFFNKNLKDDLLEKIKNGSPSERKEAMELLKAMKDDQILSDELEAEVNSVLNVGKSVEQIQATKTRAEMILMQAQSIPVGTPNRDQMIANAQEQAQQIMGGLEQQIASLKYQAYTKSLQTGEAADTTYADTMEETYRSMVSNSQILAQAKVNQAINSTNNGSSNNSAANVDNASRQARGNGVTPLIVIPQSTAHPNATQLDLPNVNNGMIRQGQNRMPAPIVQQQGQVINNVQPVPNTQVQGQVYNWNQPFANQTGLGSGPVMALPLN